MDILEPFLTLKLVWREASHGLKKSFTRYIAERYPAEFIKWTKDMRGFRQDSLTKRSSEQIGQLMDDHLFRLEGGQFAAGLLGSFLCDTCTELNRAFVMHFLERAKANRQAAAKAVRHAALQDVASSGQPPEILSLYTATLTCVEPRYSAETPPEDAFLSTIAEWIAP